MVSYVFGRTIAKSGKETEKTANQIIVTLRGAKRGSAGVPVAKREAAGDTQSVQEMTT